jgi:hypothetical protein
MKGKFLFLYLLSFSITYKCFCQSSGPWETLNLTTQPSAKLYITLGKNTTSAFGGQAYTATIKNISSKRVFIKGTLIAYLTCGNQVSSDFDFDLEPGEIGGGGSAMGINSALGLAKSGDCKGKELTPYADRPNYHEYDRIKSVGIDNLIVKDYNSPGQSSTSGDNTSGSNSGYSGDNSQNSVANQLNNNSGYNQWNGSTANNNEQIEKQKAQQQEQLNKQRQLMQSKIQSQVQTAADGFSSALSGIGSLFSSMAQSDARKKLEEQKNSSNIEFQRLEELSQSGEGEIVAHKLCNGNGHWQCNDCRGNGWKTCSGCSGNSGQTCPSCSGTGQNTFGMCTNCFGKGITQCFVCGNQGKVLCTDCSGTGNRFCSDCKGTGLEFHSIQKTIITSNTNFSTDQLNATDNFAAKSVSNTIETISTPGPADNQQAGYIDPNSQTKFYSVDPPKKWVGQIVDKQSIVSLVNDAGFNWSYGEFDYIFAQKGATTTVRNKNKSNSFVIIKNIGNGQAIATVQQFTKYGYPLLPTSAIASALFFPDQNDKKYISEDLARLISQDLAIDGFSSVAVVYENGNMTDYKISVELNNPSNTFIEDGRFYTKGTYNLADYNIVYTIVLPDVVVGSEGYTVSSGKIKIKFFSE